MFVFYPLFVSLFTLLIIISLPRAHNIHTNVQIKMNIKGNKWSKMCHHNIRHGTNSLSFWVNFYLQWTVYTVHQHIYGWILFDFQRRIAQRSKEKEEEKKQQQYNTSKHRDALCGMSKLCVCVCVWIYVEKLCFINFIIRRSMNLYHVIYQLSCSLQISEAKTIKCIQHGGAFISVI